MEVTRILLVSAFVLFVVVPPASTFVSKFGIRYHQQQQQQQQHQGGQHHRQSVLHFTTSPTNSRTTSFCRLPTTTSLWARKKAASGDEDDDWEPNEDDLVGDIEDLDLTDDGDDIQDDSVAIIANDETGDEDEDEDDDEDDLDVDIWADDDDDDDIVEEIDGELDEKEWEEDGDDGDGVSSYLLSEQESVDEDWEEDEGNSDIPLQDDPDDPNYQAQKQILEETVARREQLAADKAFDEVDFIMNKMTQEQADIFNNLDVQKEIDAMAKDMVVIDESDIEGMDLEREVDDVTSVLDDPYENDGDTNILGTGVSDDDLERLDAAVKTVKESLAQEPWDKVNLKAQTTDWDNLPNQTLTEMDACLDEISGSAYNVTNWLLYDLDFNVSNLILASVKHNRDAPILFQHWYPQLLTYERYQHARDRNFDFNWQDVEGADIEELERYYLGFGYTEIPNKAPAETGIISFEDLDEEELKMAAFENWMTEVYNPEWDRKDFDDDDFQDEDNVFSKFYEAPQHPDLPTFDDAQDDLRDWEDEMEGDEENKEYAAMMGQDLKYKYIDDEEFEKEFRGHMVVACTPMDEDLEIAEKITERMAKEFGKQVYVETRVVAHAREEDFVFEIWLESYDIDLLHSKKRAANNAEGWDGPADCDDKEIDSLVEKVRFLISDDARYSTRFETNANA